LPIREKAIEEKKPATWSTQRSLPEREQKGTSEIPIGPFVDGDHTI
jgi:hypothetical protein